MNPDRLAELEDERRYLLQSLRDLDREREADDVDDDDYQTLRDDYTVRAANVLRQIEEGRAALPQRQKRHWGKTIAGAVMVVAAAVGVGVAVAQSSGERLPGDEITGGSGESSTNISEVLTEARRMMSSDPRRAAELYRTVLDEQPEHVEAMTYYGWLTALTGSSSDDEQLQAEAIEQGEELLAEAIELDPTYADPHCLSAVVAANFKEDPQAAEGPAQTCLDLNPPAEMQGLVQQFVTNLDPDAVEE